MKLYKNLVNSVALTLQEIFTKNRYADKALEKIFKQNPQWGSRDRRFVAESVYDIVRHYRLYSELAESKNNFWFLTAVWLVVKEIELPDWPEFRHVDAKYILTKKEHLKNNLPVAESYPDWLWQLGEKELGPDRWQKEATVMNEQAPVFLRANTLKCNREKLSAELARDKIETNVVAGVDDALVLQKRENVFQNKLFKEGWFEVQDAGSQMIGSFVDPLPSETVIDACAGAGGKSLHLAALMKNKGKIISMDVEDWKLEELKKRAKRAGVHNIETHLISGDESLKKFYGKADKLLLDVPCSGLGVLRRNPDTKWKLSQEVVDRTRDLQKKILSEYSMLLKKNGRMIYSTCSLLPSENNLQVAEFIKSNPDWELEKEETIFPSQGFDGFYMARLRKKN